MRLEWWHSVIGLIVIAFSVLGFVEYRYMNQVEGRIQSYETDIKISQKAVETSVGVLKLYEDRRAQLPPGEVLEPTALSRIEALQKGIERELDLQESRQQSINSLRDNN